MHKYVAHPLSLLSLGFGLVFLEYELDCRQDLVETYQTWVSYRQPPLLFRNEGGGKFRVLGAAVGKALRQAYVGRGLAAVDYDNDGDVDLVITENGGPAHLLRNEEGNTGFKFNWQESNQTAMGSARE